jgi:hypothetical protein
MHIIRYSDYGFNTQYQSHHLKRVKDEMFHFDISIFPDHLKKVGQEIRNKHLPFYYQNFHLFKRGVWAFIDGHKNNQSLNHLRHIVPCWEADIDDNTVVIDVNWERLISIMDQECRIFGFYIPEQSMSSLKNVKRRIKR